MKLQIRSNTDEIRKKTEELNAKINDFKSLCNQSSSEALEPTDDTDIETKRGTACLDPKNVPNDIHKQRQMAKIMTDCIETSEVLSLKCLAQKAFEDSQCHCNTGNIIEIYRHANPLFNVI